MTFNFRSGAGAARSEAVAEGRYDVKMLGWNTPAEYMEFVHPYWKTFQAPNPFLHYMLAVFYVIFMFTALCGNGVVIWVFTRSVCMYVCVYTRSSFGTSR